jgi:hypothetical protein
MPGSEPTSVSPGRTASINGGAPDTSGASASGRTPQPGGLY